MDKKTQGAWIIHHTDKLESVVNAARDYEAINVAGRCGLLLSSLAASEEQYVSEQKLEALAKASNIGRLELPGILKQLKRQKLITCDSSGGVSVLGLTTTTTLEYTASIFNDSNPKNYEIAVIELSEKTSELPLDSQTAKAFISDMHKIPSTEVKSLLNASENIGFVDAEAVDSSRKIIFNGNLFRRNEAVKIDAICSSLTEKNVRKIQELDENLKNFGCIVQADAIKILGEKLLKKLHSIGLYDINLVSNEQGNFAFVTKPSAFSKFGNSTVEDAFDLAKAFVTSLTFGMTRSTSDRGKITMVQKLMQKLINGGQVGPATAIGQDYKMLELRGVIQVVPDKHYENCFWMRLLKKDVGELALKVITSGDISTEVILPSASIVGYTGPERTRTYERKKQSLESQQDVGKLLDALRTGC